MIHDGYMHLYWTTNAKDFMGYKPGDLLVTGYHGGGGFAAAPQVLVLGLATGIAPGQPTPEPAEFPPPSLNVEYRIGGRLFNGYHYKRG
jgi:hypothetical protein